MAYTDDANIVMVSNQMVTIYITVITNSNVNFSVAMIIANHYYYNYYYYYANQRRCILITIAIDTVSKLISLSTYST